MFKTPLRTAPILSSMVLALSMTPALIPPALGADLTHLRPGRLNALGALRGASPNALNSALSRHAAPTPTHRGPNVQIAPPNRGQGSATNRIPTFRIPSTGRRPSLSGMINRLNSLNGHVAPRRPSGTHNSPSSHHRFVDRVRVPNTRRPDKGHTRPMVTGGATAATIRALADRKASSRVIDKVGAAPTLQDKIAAKFAARAAMEKMAAAKDDQKGNITIDPGLAGAIKDPREEITEVVTGAGDDNHRFTVVTGAQQTFNPDLKTDADDGRSIVTMAAQTYDGTLRTDDSDGESGGAQKSDDDDKQAYDEFREQAAAASNATPNPGGTTVVTTVPLAHDKLDIIKDNAALRVPVIPGDGRPGGKGAIELFPGWLGRAPSLVRPDGTEWTEPPGTTPSYSDPDLDNPQTDQADGSNDEPSGLSMVGSASAAVGTRRGEAPLSGGSSPGSYVMQDGGSGSMTFTLAEADANGGKKEQDGAIVYFEDGSSNEYHHFESGSVNVESYDANGDATALTYIHPNKDILVHGYDDPHVDVDTGRTMEDGGKSDLDSVINREQTGQRNPEAAQGGVVLINGMPVGRLLTGNNGRNCQVAKCNDANDWFGGSVSFTEAPNPFGLFERVVNPSPRS
jgi:hypothetical protein